MKKPLLPCFLFLLIAQISIAQPKRELRGAWVATYANIDWPNKTQTPAQQRSALITILDHHKATGMNAVYIQVRSQCDALYQSSYEPWSADLTGTQGTAPNPLWDPLQFMIDETHKRGMEFHAWVNPYRAVANTGNLSSFHSTHVAKKNPSWMLTVGTVMIMNPGLQLVRDHITTVVSDIVSRYDVDGLHFDDYFYPQGTINDNSTFTADPRGFTNIGDWRRDNVNLLIKRVYDTIRTLKPWVKFGVSPSGIWRNGTSVGGSATSGLEHYTTLFADSRKWLQQGWVDYIAPQVYWYIGQPGADYSIVVPWWNNNANNRHIYVGMAGYKVNDVATYGTPWGVATVIPNEVRLNRNNPNVYGQIIYNTSGLRSTTKLGFRDSLRLNFYAKPALIPTMPWRDNIAPASPSSLIAMKYGNDSVVLNWTKTPATTDELNKAKKYVIYRSENANISTNDASNILFITISDTSAFADKTIQPNKTYYYRVTALDRFSNESDASNTAVNLPPSVTCPGDTQFFVNENCSFLMPDFRSAAIVNGGIQSSAVTITQSPAANTLISSASVTTVTLTATDKAGNTGNCSFKVTVTDTIAPQINCPAAIETTTDEGKCFAALNISSPTATDNCGISSVTGIRNDGLALSASYPKGTTLITWTATDHSGNKTTCVQTVTVADKQAPIITNASVDPSTLKAPNHKMRDINVKYAVKDNCGDVTTTITVTSNEPQNGTGDGDTDNDWIVVNDHLVQLRAERAGNGNGRVYTIEIKATDADGNSTVQILQVKVPHDHSDKSNIVSETLNEETAVATVSPNPTKAKFILQLKGSATDAASVRIIDSKGIRTEVFDKLKGNSTLHFGTNYTAGTYYAEVQIGNKKQTVKLIKQ